MSSGGRAKVFIDHPTRSHNASYEDALSMQPILDSSRCQVKIFDV